MPRPRSELASPPNQVAIATPSRYQPCGPTWVQVDVVALAEPPDDAAAHPEIVGAVALLDRAVDDAAADHVAVRSVALVDRADNTAGLLDDAVGAVAKGDVAADHAGAAGREGQGVVAAGVGETGALLLLQTKLSFPGPGKNRHWADAGPARKTGGREPSSAQRIPG